MIDIEFNIRVDEADPSEDRILDDYELALLIDHTKAQITQQVQTALGKLLCPEHQQPPRVIISGAYSLETEQLEISYHIDTCCKPFLMEAVSALNR